MAHTVDGDLIEIGKYYETRGGKRALVFFIPHAIYAVNKNKCYFVVIGEWGPWDVYSDGRVFENRNHELDLIKEIK